MKSLIKKLIPNFLFLLKARLKVTLLLIQCQYSDLCRYGKYSNTYSSSSQEKLLGRLILFYHALEKGLSFENTRIGFGIHPLKQLIKHINLYIALDYDKKQFQFRTACSVLVKYFEVNKDAGQEVDLLKSKVPQEVYEIGKEGLGGRKVILKKDIIKSTNIDFKLFFNSRYSIREFSEKKVELSKVLQALDIAKKYPSVCNRQAVRTYLIKSKKSIQEHLEYQNGNRGFRDKVDKLIVVSVELALFASASERNQPFIDGGIYTMGLLLSLHSLGLGAVALNWSTDIKSDEAYRKFSTIKDGEVIIAFIAIGNLKDEMVVAKSERNCVRDTLEIIE